MRILSELRLYICNNWVCAIPSHTIRLWYYRRVMGFSIGSGSAVFMRCYFDAAGGFGMGRNSVVNRGCRLDTRGGIAIGDNVSVSAGVTILTADHDMDNDMAGRQKAVRIEDYSWIGTHAMLLPGVLVRRGGVVAAGAVATKDVGECEVVAGVPAKHVRMRKESFAYSGRYRRLLQ